MRDSDTQKAAPQRASEVIVPETMVPILPTPAMDPTLEFYEALGFRVTYRQARPNAYGSVERGGIRLDFFVLKALDPSQSYSSCYALVSDVDSIYEDFTAGLRTLLGRLPSRGIPRIGALRDMSYGVRQFLMVDPGGNTIRIGQPIASSGTAQDREADPGGRLQRALEASILLGDSKGDHETAARVIDAALEADETAPAVVRVRALILRADIAIRAGDEARARSILETVERIELGDEDRRSIDDDLRRARDLSSELVAAGD